MERVEGEAIGARIKQARDERGMTQEDLAAMASFSKRSLQNYEAGVTVPYKHMAEIGRLVNRQQEWLLYGDEALARSDEQQQVLTELQSIKAGIQNLNTLVREVILMLEADDSSEGRGWRTTS